MADAAEKLVYRSKLKALVLFKTRWYKSGNEIHNTKVNKGRTMNLTQDFIMAVGTIKFLDKTRSKGYIQAEEIAKKLGFSAGYLHKTLQMLAKYGLVECKRGKTGGTKGRKRKITLLDIWEVTCGQIDTVSPPVPELKKPLKVFADALSKVVVCK